MTTPPRLPAPSAALRRAAFQPHRGHAWISTLHRPAPAAKTPVAPAPRARDFRTDPLAHAWLAAWYDTPDRYSGD